jgi:hypothetical protein
MHATPGPGEFIEIFPEAREKLYLIRYGPEKIASESLEPIELRYITE